MTLEDQQFQERAFGGVARIYGSDALQYFRQAHVIVVGLGGVGSWAAEALARTGVGHMTLIDFDHIAPSNINRQLHALTSTCGQAKTIAMQERLLKINPAIQLGLVDDFLKPENFETHLLKDIHHPTYILDASDDVRMKTALIVYAQKKIPLVVCGAAGGKIDPTRICRADLSESSQDPILSKIRYTLRRQFGYPKETHKKMGVRVIYSDEPVKGQGGQGLACSSYGSAMTVTATMGLAAASEILAQMQKRATATIKKS